MDSLTVLPFILSVLTFKHLNLCFAPCMVRTYAFNPSTQSGLAIGTTSLPALVLHSAAVPRHPVAAPAVSQRVTAEPEKSGWIQQKGPSLDSLVSSATSSLAGPGSIGSSSGGAHTTSTALIQEERTTLFGLRSVLINGQRFFQPLDMPQQNGGGLPMAPNPIAVHPALLAVAAVNGHEQQQNGHKRVEQPPAEWPMASTQVVENGWKDQQRATNGHTRQQHGFGLEKQSHPPPTEAPAQMLQSTVFGAELLDSSDDAPPWARGNPQPKSGLRGSREWQAANRSGLDQSLGSSTLTWPPGIDPVLQQRNEQERHRLELLQQIEENRARKARERQREWEAEERQRLRDELWQQRQRLEMEEERRREREKALAAELKAAKLAAAQRATEQAMLREAEMKKQQQGRGKQRPVREESEHDEHAEEWWERKDRRRAQQAQRAQSPAVPALQRRMNDGAGSDGRSLSVDSRTSRRGSAFGRQSRHGYSPSVASRKSTRNGELGSADQGGRRVQRSREGRQRMDFDV